MINEDAKPMLRGLKYAALMMAIVIFLIWATYEFTMWVLE